MLSQGYVKFSRGWKHNPKSPVSGSRHHKYYQVWRELCEQAGYSDEFGMTKAELTIVLSELGKTLELPKTTCFNAITYLRDHGMIEVNAGKRSLRIVVCHYDTLDCVDSYFKILHQKTSRKNDVSKNEKRSGTIHIAVNNTKSLENVTNVKTIWNDDKTSGTILERNGGDLMASNDRKKSCFRKPRGTDLERTRDILKEYNNTTTLKSSSRRLAHKRKPKRQPSESELAIATFWNDIITRHSKLNLLTVEEQAEGLLSFIEKTKVSTDLIMEVLTWASTNKYWRSQVRCLAELYLPSRQSKSVRRFQAMVSDWEYQQENSKKPKAEPSKWVGKYV